MVQKKQKVKHCKWVRDTTLINEAFTLGYCGIFITILFGAGMYGATTLEFKQVADLALTLCVFVVGALDLFIIMGCVYYIISWWRSARCTVHT